MHYLNLEKNRFMLSPKEGRSSLITEFFRIDLCCLVKKLLGKNSLDLPMKMSIYISWMSCSGTRHHLWLLTILKKLVKRVFLWFLSEQRVSGDIVSVMGIKDMKLCLIELWYFCLRSIWKWLLFMKLHISCTFIIKRVFEIWYSSSSLSIKSSIKISINVMDEWGGNQISLAWENRITLKKWVKKKEVRFLTSFSYDCDFLRNIFLEVNNVFIRLSLWNSVGFDHLICVVRDSPLNS